MPFEREFISAGTSPCEVERRRQRQPHSVGRKVRSLAPVQLCQNIGGVVAGDEREPKATTLGEMSYTQIGARIISQNTWAI